MLGLAEKHRSEKLGVSRNSLPFETRRMDDLQPGEWFREKCGFQDLHFSAIEGWKRVIGLKWDGHKKEPDVIDMFQGIRTCKQHIEAGYNSKALSFQVYHRFIIALSKCLVELRVIYCTSVFSNKTHHELDFECWKHMDFGLCLDWCDRHPWFQWIQTRIKWMEKITYVQ